MEEGVKMTGRYEENFAGEYEFVPYRESEDDAYDRLAQAEVDAKPIVVSVPTMTQAEYREHLAMLARGRAQRRKEKGI